MIMLAVGVMGHSEVGRNPTGATGRRDWSSGYRFLPPSSVENERKNIRNLPRQ